MSGWRFFFSRVTFLRWLLFQYSFRPRVTAVARKNPCHSAESADGGLQLITHAPPIWLWMKWHCKPVYGCMVYSELAPRRQQFHVAPCSHATTTQRCQYTTSVDKKNTRYKRTQSRIKESHATCARWVWWSADNSAIKKAINNSKMCYYFHLQASYGSIII